MYFAPPPPPPPQSQTCSVVPALEKLWGEYDLCLNLIYLFNGVYPFTGSRFSRHMWITDFGLCSLVKLKSGHFWSASFVFKIEWMNVSLVFCYASINVMPLGGGVGQGVRIWHTRLFPGSGFWHSTSAVGEDFWHSEFSLFDTCTGYQPVNM